jgi:hypothetical protein
MRDNASHEPELFLGVAQRFAGDAELAGRFLFKALPFTLDAALAELGQEIGQAHEGGGVVEHRRLPAALAERTDMTPDIVKHWVREGISMMPFFRPTEISNADLEALARYLTRTGGG